MVDAIAIPLIIIVVTTILMWVLFKFYDSGGNDNDRFA